MFRPYSAALRRTCTALALGATLLGAQNVLACSSCGCSLGTDWSDAGLTTAAGLKLGLRYDFVDQNQLRLGRSPVTPSTSAPPVGLEEVQQSTRTSFYTLSADYAIDTNWGVDLQLPYLVRLHETVPVPSADPGAELDTSDYRGIGDLRVVARYQGLRADHGLGLQFGLKLPTGAFHQSFAGGPDAGAPVDRGLQPGTGTTDLVVGVYEHAFIGTDWDHFEQIQYKLALNSREQFRPGPTLDLNLGLRYLAFETLVPQLQLNARWEGREIGAQADYDNSASRVVDLSPGLSVRLRPALYVYGFVQLPVYQDYAGYQLAPRYTLSTGLSFHF